MLVFVKNIAPLVLYFIFWAVFLVSVSGRGKYGLLFLVFLLPLQNVLMKLHNFPLGKDLNDIILIGMIIGCVICNTAHQKPLFEKSSLNVILFLYLIYTYISLWRGSAYLGFPAPLSAADPRVQNWKNYMLLPLLFILSFNSLESKKDIVRVLMVMCCSMMIMNFYTVNQLRWITSWMSRSKLSGTFVWLGANEVAAFYAAYTLALFGLWIFVKNKIVKLLLLGLIAINFYCDLFLFSRGAYLATLVGLAFISLIRQKKVLIVIVLVVLFWNMLLPYEVIERIKFTRQGEQNELDASAQTRIDLWRESLVYFQNNPILGVGYNVFVYLGLRKDTHNLYLRTLAEQGVFGLFFLLLIMGVAWKKGWNLYRSSQDHLLKGLGLGFCGCTLAVIVGNIFGDRWSYLPLAAYFWVFLGMVERGTIITQQEACTVQGKKK